MISVRKCLAFTILLMMMSVSAMALEVTVLDEDGREAVMTGFEHDGLPAWWAELPEGSAFDGLSVRLSDDSGEPASFTVSLPDAGADYDSGAYAVFSFHEQEIRLFASHLAYAPAADGVRSVRAVGQWARLLTNAQLLARPDAQADVLGTIDSSTRFFLLYTCRNRGTEYACVRVAGQTCFLKSEDVRVLSEATSLNLDARLLSERRSADDVRFARAAYQANIRSAIGTSKDAIIGTVPIDSLLLVLTSVTLDRVVYDLVYVPETAAVGFAHDTQLAALTDAEAAALLADRESGGTDAPRAGATNRAVPLLAYPASDAGIIQSLASGTGVTVYAAVDSPEGRFWLAEAGEQLGYLPDSALTLTGGTPDTQKSLTVQASLEDALYSQRMTVAVREALLYQQPSYTAACAARLSDGAVVTVLAGEAGWLQVSAADQIGWLPAEYVSPVRLGAMEE